MADHAGTDPFAALFPEAAASMPTAWRHLRVPGPPREFSLGADETRGLPTQRFRRRTILTIGCGTQTRSTGVVPSDTLALVDKAAPHAGYDLMLSEVSDRSKSTPDAVLPETGRALWRTASEFVRFVSDRATQERYSLDAGRLALAFNCDPYTSDRESVQAAKQYHLHLIYWRAAELAAIAAPEPAGATRDPRLRRQLLDPLSFLGGPLIEQALTGLDLTSLGARILPQSNAAIAVGARPPGCLIELPCWAILATPDFEVLIRSIHRRLSAMSGVLYQAFVGRTEPPPPWRRHPLRADAERRTAVQALGLPRDVSQGLTALGQALRDLPPPLAERLRHGSPAWRQHCMTLNQPCYGLTLYSPSVNTMTAPVMDHRPIHLLLTAKLFSGIGCAGLLPLGRVPSVRILRGQGRYSEQEWRDRATFQRAFAVQLSRALSREPEWRPGPVTRLRDFALGWR